MTNQLVTDVLWLNDQHSLPVVTWRVCNFNLSGQITNYPESSWINGFIMVDRSPVSKYTPQRSMLNSVLVSFQQRFFNNTLFKFNTRWSQSVHRRLVSWQTMASTPLESTHAALAVTEEADAGVASSAATGACKLVLWPGHSLLLFFFLLSPSTCLSLLRLSVSRDEIITSLTCSFCVSEKCLFWCLFTFCPGRLDQCHLSDFLETLGKWISMVECYVISFAKM